MRKTFAWIIVIGGTALAFACARPREEKAEAKTVPKAEYKTVKPDEFPIPAKLAEALPGLVNDKIRIWKEISPSINLVVYAKGYNLKKAMEESARAFLALSGNPEFRNRVDFWIIQIQPEQGPEVLVWGARPSEVDQYQKTLDLKSFFRDSEYVLINDQIISKGDDRLKSF